MACSTVPTPYSTRSPFSLEVLVTAELIAVSPALEAEVSFIPDTLLLVALLLLELTLVVTLAVVESACAVFILTPPTNNATPKILY